MGGAGRTLWGTAVVLGGIQPGTHGRVQDSGELSLRCLRSWMMEGGGGRRDTPLGGLPNIPDPQEEG